VPLLKRKQRGSRRLAERNKVPKVRRYFARDAKSREADQGRDQVTVGKGKAKAAGRIFADTISRSGLKEDVASVTGNERRSSCSKEGGRVRRSPTPIQVSCH